MNSAILLVLASVMASTLALPTPACVPPQTQFYWKVPCDGQTFPNRITVTNVTATQGGKPVDQQGGMDLSKPLDLVVSINDAYGVISKPLLDIGIVEYSKHFGKCQWNNVPTLGLLSNIDSCGIVENCHLNNNPTTLAASIDIKKIAGPLYAGINVNDYYGLSLTFKDDKTPVLCVYAQNLVINK